MKKVLIIIGKLAVGGAEKIARDIGYFADKNKYEIHYLVYGTEVEAYEEQLLVCGCKIIHFPWPSTNYLKYYLKLKELFLKEKYDVLHAHTMFNSGWAILAGKRCGIPVRITHSHSTRNKNNASLLQTLYQSLMRRIICTRSTVYLACGKDAGEWLFGKKFFSKHGRIIINGIDVSNFAFSPEKREKLREQLALQDAFLLGHAGHLETVKNQIFLIHLMPQLLKIKNNAKLILLGDGKDRKRLTAEIEKLSLQDCVYLPGNVSNMADYLSAMDVFVFPSLYEGTPLALIEAQASGLPCVISDRIPCDVYLTDLIHPLPLEAESEVWVETICATEHKAREDYAEIMKDLGLDTQTMLLKIYQIYEG